MSAPNPLQHHTVIIVETIQYSYDIEAPDRDAAVDEVAAVIDERGFDILSVQHSDWDYIDVLHLGPVVETHHV